MKATDALREEHRRILDVLGVLERILDAGSVERADADSGFANSGPADPGAARADGGASLDLPALDDCLAFFRLFTDACHHGKEEDVLFPALEEHGISASEGPIAVMLEEHAHGRALVGRMTEALDGIRGADDSAATRLERAGRDYIALLRDHIEREDGALFQVADTVLTGPACRRVCEDYHPACLERLGGGTGAELEALAERLLAAYPPP